MKIETHCPHCMGTIAEPTAMQDLRLTRPCPLCGKPLPRKYTDEEWIIRLDQRLEDIEKELFGKAARQPKPRPGDEFC